MKNYTFTRDLNLGIVQLSVKRGQIVTQKNGAFIYNNTKFDNTRDFQIAMEKGWLVDSEQFIQSENVVQSSTNNFGFEVKKQQQNVVSISINKFKQNVLNENEGFIEDGQQIKSLEQSNIHVATATDVKQEQSKQEQIKQEVTLTQNKATQSEVDKEVDKTTVKKKTTAKSASKQAKKEQPKKSRIIKDSQIGKQQVVGEVMGMKIIKGE